MNGSRLQALQDARKLVRTFGSAPDARGRASAVLSELKRAEGWSDGQRREIAAVAEWLQAGPSVTTLEARLRALIAALS